MMQIMPGGLGAVFTALDGKYWLGRYRIKKRCETFVLILWCEWIV